MVKLFTHEKDRADLANFDVEAASEGDFPRICDRAISQKEVEDALKKLSPGKATGLDDIPPVLLCDRSKALTKALTYIFNDLLQSGTFPKQWKTDRRIVLYKKGGKTIVSNYRLIAIHSVFRKLLCCIIHERIRGFIKLDDAQNGFRTNRRGTENALILNNLIKEQSLGAGAYVIVVDFSKAFDRCHIATLLKKLSQKNVKGKLLRLIKDLYTGSEAQLFINGKAGSAFEVTRGVAQGCVLSPLFFDVYLDDLLSTFRQRGLGVPIGQIIHGASSFADDLALVAPDKQTAEAYLSILEKWCAENFFKVNTDKSGILRVGELRSQPDPNFSLKDERIRLLEEEDPIHKDVERFKYLGFMISPDGKWDDFVNLRIQRCKQALGQYWRFFKLANISVDLKLRAAQALIFSHLAYGKKSCASPKSRPRKSTLYKPKLSKQSFNFRRK